MPHPHDANDPRRPESRAADTMRADPASLLSIIDSAMDAIITTDDQQRVVLFNRAAERVFGVSAAEALGSPLGRFIPAQFRDKHAEFVRQFGQTGASQRAMGRLGTIHGLRSDGREFPIEASISHATHNGRRLFTVILRDISEAKRIEAQLLQAQKMESVGRLAGGVAHDFNNLLMAMTNYLELAQRRLEPGHASRAHLRHVQEAADRAAGLTRQLLAFARKQVIHPRVLCPREVVTNIEPMLRRMIGEDLTLRTTLAADAGSVLADVSQLEQVLMNLAVNARDAMPRGGTLTIETRNIRLDEEYCRSRVGATPGEYVLIAVTDSGAGMTPEVLSRLFEPFFTTKAPGKGTGLGLATCHGIVNQHGGHISVYSEVNRGTSVKVFLPRVAGASERASPATPAPLPPRGTETLLLAEDSEMVRDLAATALREAGYTVLAAGDGRAALDAANKFAGPIQLVITDVVMPEMNGVALARALVAHRPGVRVLFMSGYTEDTISGHGVPADGANFMAKPFMTDALLKKVREVLDAPPAPKG